MTVTQTGPYFYETPEKTVATFERQEEMELLMPPSEMEKLTEITDQAAALSWHGHSLALACSWLTIDLYLRLRIVSKRLCGSAELRVRGGG